MAKYGGLPGEYYYKLKSHANKTKANAQAKGYRVRLSKWQGFWLLKVSK